MFLKNLRKRIREDLRGRCKIEVKHIPFLFFIFHVMTSHLELLVCHRSCLTLTHLFKRGYIWKIRLLLMLVMLGDQLQRTCRWKSKMKHFTSENSRIVEHIWLNCYWAGKQCQTINGYIPNYKPVICGLTMSWAVFYTICGTLLLCLISS